MLNETEQAYFPSLAVTNRDHLIRTVRSIFGVSEGKQVSIDVNDLTDGQVSIAISESGLTDVQLANPDDLYQRPRKPTEHLLRKRMITDERFTRKKWCDFVHDADVLYKSSKLTDDQYVQLLTRARGMFGVYITPDERVSLTKRIDKVNKRIAKAKREKFISEHPKLHIRSVAGCDVPEQMFNQVYTGSTSLLSRYKSARKEQRDLDSTYVQEVNPSGRGDANPMAVHLFKEIKRTERETRKHLSTLYIRTGDGDFRIRETVNARSEYISSQQAKVSTYTVQIQTIKTVNDRIGSQSFTPDQKKQSVNIWSEIKRDAERKYREYKSDGKTPQAVQMSKLHGLAVVQLDKLSREKHDIPMFSHRKNDRGLNIRTTPNPVTWTDQTSGHKYTRVVMPYDKERVLTYNGVIERPVRTPLASLYIRRVKQLYSQVKSELERIHYEPVFIDIINNGWTGQEYRKPKDIVRLSMWYTRRIARGEQVSLGRRRFKDSICSYLLYRIGWSMVNTLAVMSIKGGGTGSVYKEYRGTVSSILKSSISTLRKSSSEHLRSNAWMFTDAEAIITEFMIRVQYGVTTKGGHRDTYEPEQVFKFSKGTIQANNKCKGVTAFMNTQMCNGGVIKATDRVCRENETKEAIEYVRSYSGQHSRVWVLNPIQLFGRTAGQIHSKRIRRSRIVAHMEEYAEQMLAAPTFTEKTDTTEQQCMQSVMDTLSPLDKAVVLSRCNLPAERPSPVDRKNYLNVQTGQVVSEDYIKAVDRRFKESVKQTYNDRLNRADLEALRELLNQSTETYVDKQKRISEHLSTRIKHDIHDDAQMFDEQMQTEERLYIEEADHTVEEVNFNWTTDE